MTRRLNRPALASIKIPMDAAIGGAGSILKVVINGSLRFHGFILNCETDAGEDDGYTVYNAADPMELWQWRPARDDTGDFTVPTFIADYVTGSLIIEDILSNSISNGGGVPPLDAEGPLFLDFGSFAAGGVDLTGAPTDYPMTIAQIVSLLVSTGTVDVVITPTDPGGGVMGTVSGYNGDYGSDLSGSVVFSYGTGALNVRRMRWNEDMSNVVNKIKYYLGPRVGTPTDPAGDQHWRGDVQGFDPDLAYPPGGQSVDVNNDPAGPPWTDNQLGEKIYNSRVAYGVRYDVRIYDGDDEVTAKELYLRLWQGESWFRATPRELIHITPTAGTAIGSFDIGDLIGVEAASSVRGGFSGAQRVYEYTISWDEDGPFELAELQTSPNNEGFL